MIAHPHQSDALRTVALGSVAAVIADPVMLEIYALVERLALAELPVLVCGETGTGKELVAAALHHWSRRHDGPHVVINCAAFQETLLESELFGHERGAFTGAISAKSGLFERANGGTIVLDEIGELSPCAQAKLLRVLEEKRVTRVGAVRACAIDVRFVAVTNRDLQAEVRAGRFRQDLFFRLSGGTVRVPPLRDRPSDLAPLARAFLEQACVENGRPPKSLTSRALHALSRHDWPGNVRELRHLMEFVAATVPEATIEPWHLSDHLGAARPTDSPAGPSLEDELRALERSRMAAALATTGGNRTRAAALLGMPLRTFQTRLKQYGINASRGR